MKQLNKHIGIFILRLTLGFCMLLHGISKISNGIAGLKSTFTEVGIPEVLAYSVYIGEVLAPVMVILGFRTKLGAGLIAFTMLIAVLLSHPDQIFALNKHGAWAIELQALYLFGSIALIFTGSGRIALSNTNKWD